MSRETVEQKAGRLLADGRVRLHQVAPILKEFEKHANPLQSRKGDMTINEYLDPMSNEELRPPQEGDMK